MLVWTNYTRCYSNWIKYAWVWINREIIFWRISWIISYFKIFPTLEQFSFYLGQNHPLLFILLWINGVFAFCELTSIEFIFWGFQGTLPIFEQPLLLGVEFCSSRRKIIFTLFPALSSSTSWANYPVILLLILSDSWKTCFSFWCNLIDGLTTYWSSLSAKPKVNVPGFTRCWILSLKRSLFSAYFLHRKHSYHFLFLWIFWSLIGLKLFLFFDFAALLQ